MKITYGKTTSTEETLTVGFCIDYRGIVTKH